MVLCSLPESVSVVSEGLSATFLKIRAVIVRVFNWIVWHVICAGFEFCGASFFFSGNGIREDKPDFKTGGAFSGKNAGTGTMLPLGGLAKKNGRG